MATKRRRRKSGKPSDPALQFTDEDIQIVRFYLFQTLQSQPRIKTKDLFDIVRDDLSSPITVSTFQLVFGLNLKNNRIPGYITAKGRNGGVFLDDPEVASENLPDEAPPKAEMPESSEVTEEEIDDDEIIDDFNHVSAKNLLSSTYIAQPEVPKEKELFKTKKPLNIIVNGTTFSVPMRHTDIVALIEKVFDGSEDENGEIEYIGKKYNCSNSSILTKFLFFFFEAGVPANNFGSVINKWDETKQQSQEANT